MSNFQQELINNSLGIHLRMVMDENKKFRLQLKAVRKLHEAVLSPPRGFDPGHDRGAGVCLVCEWSYPCPTIKALDGEIGSAEPVKLGVLDGEQK